MNLTRFLNRYGRLATVTLSDGSSSSILAVITPLRYKNRLYEEGAYTPAGHVNGGQFLYISRYSAGEVLPGCRVSASGKQYTVKTWEVLYLGEKPAFIHAILQAAKGAEDGLL